MPTVYVETPHNFSDISSCVITDVESISELISRRRKCFFYDACSFRRHANLKAEEAVYFLNYIKQQEGVLVVTRTILMELGSHSGILNPAYVQYLRRIKTYGIDTLLLYEEDLFHLMAMSYGTNAAINSYLTWAVRMIKEPVSTIEDTFALNSGLADEVIKRKNRESKGVYERFFRAVRDNKQPGDNLGEELLTICLHILSNLRGDADGKYCMITDDKKAALKAYGLFEKTAVQYRGRKIIILSTPKLVQILRRERILTDREHMRKILSAGTEGNLSLIAARIYDLKCKEMTMSVDELTDLIMEPNGISILF